MLLADIINTLSLWQWGLLGLIPPAILALYFLKLKRQPLAVPSTYLWSKTIEDLHVNSLWQRLRQSLLLLLQLLLIFLLAVTLLRPGWKGTELIGHRFVLLIDASASMRAVDVKPTRLDEAKQQAIKIIDQMRPGDAAMVISFSSSAKVEQQFTSNRRDLRNRVEQIAQTNHTSNLDEAVRAAAGLANPGQSGDPNNPDDAKVADALPATMYLFSDGGFPPVKNFKLGNLEPIYVKIAGEQQNNVGVVAFTTEINPDKLDKLVVFARVENFSDQPAAIIAALYTDADRPDYQEVKIAARDKDSRAPGSAGVKFVLPRSQALEDLGVVRLELDLQQTPDDLAVDNKAYALVARPQAAKVLLVTPGNNDALELALSTEEAKKICSLEIMPPAALAEKPYLQQSEKNSWDLIIYDQCAPKAMPEANTLFIGRTPPEGWTHGEKQGRVILTDVDQRHELTQLVEMSNVRVVEAMTVKGPAGTAALISSNLDNGEPVYAIGPRLGRSYEDAVLGFEIVGQDKAGQKEINTDWMIRRSFPVFAMNAVKYLGKVRQSQSGRSVLPGEVCRIRSATALPQVTVKSPRGDRFDIAREAQFYSFTHTDELGAYAVFEAQPDKPAQQFVVNLFDSRESNLLPAEVVEIEHEQVEASINRQQARKELWKWLLLGAISLLIFEWYIYNRRVYL